MSQVQSQARADRLFLEVGVERGYLTPPQVARIQAEMERSGRSAEQSAEKLEILSRRRVQRLLNHVRFKSLRQVDKVYLKAAVKAGLITQADADWSLRTQRERFEQGRERLRAGSLLLERRLLRPEQDRDLSAKVAQELALREPSGVGSGSSAALGDLKNDSSATPVGAVQRDTRARAAGYAADTAARQAPRPEAASAPIRAEAASAPTRVARPATTRSEPKLELKDEEPPPQMMDSAEAYERACIQLARRRIEG